MASEEPTRAERAAWGRIGAHVAHANNDSRAMTNNARRAFLDSFEQQVDPDGTLAPAERAKRAEHARRAHMQRLAMKSAEARRRNKRPASEPSTSSMSTRPPRAADGVESSAARSAGRAKVTTTPRVEVPPSPPGDGVDLAADVVDRRAS